MARTFRAGAAPLAAVAFALFLAGPAGAQETKPAAPAPQNDTINGTTNGNGINDSQMNSPAGGPTEPAPGSGAAAGADGAQVTVAPPEAVTLAARPVLYVTGKSSWDDAEEGLGNALNAIFAAIAKGGLKASGAAMIEYLDSGDEDFRFKAMVPVETPPKAVNGKDVKVGEGPAGPALKFVHHGSFEDLEEVYNRIDDYLGAKGLTMKKVYEEYETDPATTPAEKMVTNIYVVTE